MFDFAHFARDSCDAGEANIRSHDTFWPTRLLHIEAVWADGHATGVLGRLLPMAVMIQEDGNLFTSEHLYRIGACTMAQVKKKRVQQN
jgi:hypothetical protein